MDDALVYTAGFVVGRILSRLSCAVCRVGLMSSLSESYHLLKLKNSGGLVIPSDGTVKAVRAAGRAIRRSPGRAPQEAVVTQFVHEEVGTQDVFPLGEHIEEMQFGIDNHQSLLLTLTVCVDEDKAAPRRQNDFPWLSERKHKREAVHNSSLSGVLAS